MFDTVKCKKCRHTLCDDTQCSLLINAHGLIRSKIEVDEACATIADDNLLFFGDDSLPDWIRVSVESENWSKGKLNCTHCGARIGAFDFVSGIKCACDKSVLPAVHLIKSKVDLIYKIFIKV